MGRMWGECGEECEDECGDQCGDSFTVVAALAEIASAVQKMKLPCIHNLHDKVCKENEDELFIDRLTICK